MTKMQLGKTLLVIITLLAQGCGDGQADERTINGDESSEGTSSEAGDDEGFRWWTGTTSEEDPPITCPNRYYAKGFECSGGYCDNIRMDCQYSAVAHGDSSWTSYFSEEPTNYRHCPWGEFITGLRCSGSNCDNVSFECTEATGKSFSGCKWSLWYSEEHGPFQAPTNYYIKGMQCRGRFCDDKRYRYCKMVDA